MANGTEYDGLYIYLFIASHTMTGSIPHVFFFLAAFHEISNIEEASADPHEADVDMVGWRGRQGLHSIDVFRFAVYLGYKWERPRIGPFFVHIWERLYSSCLFLHDLECSWDDQRIGYLLTKAVN